GPRARRPATTSPRTRRIGNRRAGIKATESRVLSVEDLRDRAHRFTLRRANTVAGGAGLLRGPRQCVITGLRDHAAGGVDHLRDRAPPLTLWREQEVERLERDPLGRRAQRQHASRLAHLLDRLFLKLQA